MSSQGLGAAPLDARTLGRGWAAPAGVDGVGEARLESGAEKVRQSIRLVLGTRRGERGRDGQLSRQGDGAAARQA